MNISANTEEIARKLITLFGYTGNVRAPMKTGASRWDGDRPDYDLGVMVLLQQARRVKGKDVPAETPKHISVEVPTDVPAEAPPPDSVHPNDIVWASIEDHPGYQEMKARIAERQRMFAEEDREYRRLEKRRASRRCADVRQ